MSKVLYARVGEKRTRGKRDRARRVKVAKKPVMPRSAPPQFETPGPALLFGPRAYSKMLATFFARCMKHSNDFSEPFEMAPGKNLIWVPFTVRMHEKFYPPLTNSSYGHAFPSPSFASRIILELAVTITATAFHIGHSESGIPRHRIVSVRPTELKSGLIFCNAFVIWEIMDWLDAFVEMLSQFRVSDAYFTVTVVADDFVRPCSSRSFAPAHLV
ncbi:hypothetical protein K438DRAFT_1774947 [Mycena galopus ATCC 62051]|nr:hypothetical protein K438DRAFT_1774947 [Mycena galopus ATCC 62051]